MTKSMTKSKNISPCNIAEQTLSRRNLIERAATGGAVLGVSTLVSKAANAQLFGNNSKPEFKRLGKDNMLAGRSFKGQRAPEIVFEQWVANAPASTAGKPILLKFFSTRCSICQASVPALNRLHAEIGNRITMIALSNEESKFLESFFVGAKGITYPVASDTQKRLFNTYEMTEAYPHYVIIDTSGIVTYEGIMPYTQYERMRDRIIQKARI